MAFQVIGDFSTQNQPADILSGVDYLINTGGTVFTSSLSLKVTEKSGAPDLSVDIAAGDALVPYGSYALGAGSQKYFLFRNTAAANVTISANASGLSRITSILAKVNTAAADSIRGVDAGSIVALDGTPAASPTATAIPANHLKLADVTVANGASSITNANITDRRSEIMLRNSIFDEPTLANAKYVKGTKTDGTASNIIGVDSSNNAEVGSASFTGLELIAGGTITVTGSGNFTAEMTGDVLLPSKIAARVFTSALQSIPTSTNTKLAFDSETYDIGGDFNTATNRFVAPVNGYYRCSSTVRVNDIGDGLRGLLYLFKDNSEYSRTEVDQPGAATDMSTTLYDIAYATAGSYFEFWYNHNAATAKSAQNSSTITYATFELAYT